MEPQADRSVDPGSLNLQLLAGSLFRMPDSDPTQVPSEYVIKTTTTAPDINGPTFPAAQEAALRSEIEFDGLSEPHT